MTTESPKLLDPLRAAPNKGRRVQTLKQILDGDYRPNRPARRNSSSRSGTVRQFTVPHRQIIDRAGEQLA